VRDDTNNYAKYSRYTSRYLVDYRKIAKTVEHTLYNLKFGANG